MKKIILSFALGALSVLASAQTDKAVSSDASQNQMRVVLQNGTTKYYNTGDVESVTLADKAITVDAYTTQGVSSINFKKSVDVENTTVNIVKGEGWLNSAYIIFEQIDGATYKVLCDDEAIDEPLIRYYNTYTYYEYTEDEDLQVTWQKKTLSNVVRADALGLAAGEHTLKVCAVVGDVESDYSVATLDVIDHDRSGFAFTGAKTPGAYNADGTLKSNAIVLYVTAATAKTVSYTAMKGVNSTGNATFTGLQDVLSETSLKKLTVPLDIRIIGTITESDADELASSAEGLQIKTTTDNGITVEGVGHDASVYGFGFLIRAAKYVELSNLGIYNFKDDGISIDTDNSYLWVHNNDISYGAVGSDADQAKGDGSLDFKKSTYSSLCYNHFWDSGKCNLLDASAGSDGSNYLSYHHNWYDHSDSRHPRIRNASAVHVYNNYYDGNSKYGVGVTSGSSAFVEGNFFRDANAPMMSSMQGTDAQGSGTFSGEDGGVIKAWNNYIGNNSYNTLHLITNKYDYTNKKAVEEPTTHTETVGTDNGDGTWTIYDANVSSTTDEIASSAFITTVNATNKGAYYQVSKGKVAFKISVPANTTKVIVKAKCGSSSGSGTADMLKVNGTAVKMDMTANYTAYEVEVSLSEDTQIEIANANGSYSMNINEIKVVASSAWSTTYTTGISLSDIDAYEVDSRNATVPSTVVTKQGGTTYSNFDTTLGDSGLGLSAVPSSPEQAKADVMLYSGRHNPDFAWTFVNATEDKNYSVISELKAAIVAYANKLTQVQGSEVINSGSNTDDNTSDNGDDNNGESGSDDNGDNNSGETTGSAIVSLVVDGAVAPSDSRVTCTSCSVNSKESNGAITIEYNGVTYSTIKMESSSTITVKAAEGVTITVIGSLPSGKQKCFKLNGTAVSLDDKTTGVTTFEKSFTATGEDVITKGDVASIALIITGE